MNFSNRYFLLFIKALVFVLMAWVIVDRLWLQNDFEEQVALFKKNLSAQNLYLIVIAVCLMPLNWLLETLKWRVLLRDTVTSFSTLLKGVVAGITFGFVTPGRGGEFIGRVMYLDDENKSKVFYLSSIGGLAQTVITLMAGALFIFWVYPDPFINGLAIGAAAVAGLLYFRFDLLNRLITAIPILKNNQLIIDEADLPAIEQQVNVLGLSLVRYSVYLLQYVLVFLFFGVNNNSLQLLAHSSVLLMVHTFSPLMPLLDASFRGGAALWVFSKISSTDIAVISAAMFVWLLNLVIPSVIGYLFILRKKN